jgi:hypothetical protein
MTFYSGNRGFARQQKARERQVFMAAIVQSIVHPPERCEQPKRREIEKISSSSQKQSDR